MADLSRVLIMAGGTGGHVFPGLAIAKNLRSQGITVNWLGTHKGLEAKLVPEAGIPIHYISISGFRGKRLRDKLSIPWQLAKSLVQSMRIIQQVNPDIVIGLGGFVSGPGGIASRLLGKMLVIHEQNAKPGSTNKWLAKVAHRVFEAFPLTFVKRNNVVTVGNPVRPEIAALPAPSNRFAQKAQAKHLLVLGGSLGAQAINELVPKALAKLPEALRPSVWHQTGEKHLSETQAAYKNAGVTAEIAPFIVEMDKAYAWADVVLCRAGALTVAELCAAGLGAILVPFPHAIDDHQTANANFMVKQSAALLIQQAELTEDKLAKLLEELCCSGEQYRAMAQAAYTLRKIDAADEIINNCKKLLSKETNH